MSTALKSYYHRKLKLPVALLIAILLTLPPLVNIFIGSAKAANLTSYKVEIGDSRAGLAASHRFTFVTPSTTNIKTITFQYCTTASGSCTAPDGMILAATPVFGTVAGIGGTTYTPTSTSANCTGAGNTDCTLTLTVTTPGAQSAGATVIVPFDTGVTNPSTTDTTYYARITTKDGSAVTIDGPNAAAFAILTATSLAVSATVDPNLTFSIAAVNSGGSVNGATTTVTTGVATVPFGTLTAGTPSIGAHDVTVTTNAGSGYTVTASHSATAIAGFPPLVSGATNNVDTFSGTNASPTVWSEPAGTTANTNTGYFGYTTEDASLCTGTAARFTDGGNEWAGSSTVGAEVVCAPSGVNAETTRIGWQVEVNGIQPAGGYTGTAILVATPTY
jgi:hypothetical protein